MKKQLRSFIILGVVVVLLIGAYVGVLLWNKAQAERAKQEKDDIPADVRAIAEERWAARTNRDWAKSDELRAKLAEMGYAVKDSKTGYELIKN